MELFCRRFFAVLPLCLGILMSPTMLVAQDMQLKEPVLRAHLSYLSDDLLEGRGTGQRGGDLAARYLATQAQIIGLQNLSKNPNLPYLH